MIHNKEVNIRLNKSQKIIEDKGLHSTPLRQILAFHNLSSEEIFILDTRSSLVGSTVVVDTGVDTDTDEGKEVNDTGMEEAASTGGGSELAVTGVDTDTGEGKEVFDAGTEEAVGTVVGSNEVETEAASADDNNEVDREAASAAGSKIDGGGIDIGWCSTSSAISVLSIIGRTTCCTFSCTMRSCLLFQS
jgi:hypothetical protein